MSTSERLSLIAFNSMWPLVLAIVLVVSYINGPPAPQTPEGLQSQITALKEDLSSLPKYIQLAEKIEADNKLLLLRTEHLHATEFTKAIQKDTDWRMAPEIRRNVLLNHRAFLIEQLDAIRRAMEDNKTHTEWTDREIERKAEAVAAEIKALPPNEKPATETQPPPPAQPTAPPPRRKKPKPAPAAKPEPSKVLETPIPDNAEGEYTKPAPKVEVTPPSVPPR